MILALSREAFDVQIIPSNNHPTHSMEYKMITFMTKPSTGASLRFLFRSFTFTKHLNKLLTHDEKPAALQQGIHRKE